jgi:hypothetical protein
MVLQTSLQFLSKTTKIKMNDKNAFVFTFSAKLSIIAYVFFISFRHEVILYKVHSNVHRTQPPTNQPQQQLGHPEGTEPKTGEDTMASKRGEGHVVSQMIRTQRGRFRN